MHKNRDRGTRDAKKGTGRQGEGEKGEKGEMEKRN
jgi:hypothetical protein